MVSRMTAPHSLDYSQSGLKRNAGMSWRVMAIASLAVALISARALSAQEENAEASLAGMAERFDEALALVHQPITSLNQSYQDALKRLLASETEAGNLDGALQVQQEIDAFGDGSRFDLGAFSKKPADHPSVATMKSKYLSERGRLWNSTKRSRDELVRSYREALAVKEKELTKLGDLNEALAARQAVAALGSDPRLVEDSRSSRPKNQLPSKIRFVAKGEVEIRHNDSRLQYRNSSPDRNKYIDGTSAEFNVTVGDVVVVRMRATAVYRAFIMTIESNDGKTAIPVAREQFRYLGPDVSSIPEIESLLRVTTVADSGAADADMEKMWADMPISDLSRSGSDWIKCGPGTDWHTYAILIMSEMLLSVPTE